MYVKVQRKAKVKARAVKTYVIELHDGYRYMVQFNEDTVDYYLGHKDYGGWMSVCGLYNKDVLHKGIDYCLYNFYDYIVNHIPLFAEEYQVD